MIVLQITSVKDFMNRMLRTELFDHFLLSEATIRGQVSYVIDGHIVKDSLTDEELLEGHLEGLSCMPFGKLRDKCFALFKGKHTPSYFKFVFQLSPENLNRTLERSKSSVTMNDLNAVCINIRFQDGILTCTSGVSYRSFLLDHTFEQEWDALVQRFLLTNEIACMQKSASV